MQHKAQGAQKHPIVHSPVGCREAGRPELPIGSIGRYGVGATLFMQGEK